MFVLLVGLQWGLLAETAGRPPGCVIIKLAGIKPGALKFELMGEYEAQAQTHDGKPVYKQGPYFMFFSQEQNSWNVGSEVGSKSSVGLSNRVTDGTDVNNLRGTWSIVSDSGQSRTPSQTTSHCSASCKIINVRGQSISGPKSRAMGDYILQERMNDGRPVYELMDDEYVSKYMFYSKQYKSWSIGSRVGGDQFDLFVSSEAFTPVRITGTWKVSVNGTFAKDKQIGAICAASCKAVVISGQTEGQAQTDCMGMYTLLGVSNDNKPVYRLTGGSKYIYYQRSYENWNVGESIGGNRFDMFVSSRAESADQIKGVWKINVKGKFTGAPAVRARCAADTCSPYAMSTDCTSHPGCGWCADTSSCTTATRCLSDWSQNVRLTPLLDPKQAVSMRSEESDEFAESKKTSKLVIVSSLIALSAVFSSWFMLLYQGKTDDEFVSTASLSTNYQSENQPWNQQWTEGDAQIGHLLA